MALDADTGLWIESLSDQEKKLLIEKYTGDLDKEFVSRSIIQGWAEVRPVTGTDTISVRRFGKSSVRKVNPGVRPTSGQIKTDKIQLTVDTLIYQRESFSKLGEVQQDINMTSETALQHGKEMARLYDTTFFIMAVRGSFETLSNAQKLGGAFYDGINEVLDEAGDEQDADAVVAKMESVITEFRKRDLPLDGFKWFVTPECYQVLKDHPKLINQDYTKTANGDFALREVKKLGGVDIIEVPGERIPQEATDQYVDLFDNNDLEVTATMANVFAVLVSPTSLLIGESIGLSGRIFYSELEKLWFVDSDRSYNLRVRNPGLCATVRKVSAEDPEDITAATVTLTGDSPIEADNEVAGGLYIATLDEPVNGAGVKFELATFLADDIDSVTYKGIPLSIDDLVGAGITLPSTEGVAELDIDFKADVDKTGILTASIADTDELVSADDEDTFSIVVDTTAD